MVNPPGKETKEGAGKTVRDGGAILGRNLGSARDLRQASLDPASEMFPTQLPDVLNPAGCDERIVEGSHLAEMGE